MADEPDGVDEALEGMLRVGLTAAGRLAEVAARAREQAARNARAASGQQSRELAGRLQAERAAARAQLAPVDRADWWEGAGPDDIARMWETAGGWRQLDGQAEWAADRIRRETRDRYGIDVDTPGGDPAAVRAALERGGIAETEAGRQRTDLRAQETEAAQLLAAADRADRADRQSQPEHADSRPGAAADRYDTAHRRRQLADSLEGVADGETIAARVTADTMQAWPAADAVTQTPPQPAAGRPRLQTPGRRRQRTPGLSR